MNLSELLENRGVSVIAPGQKHHKLGWTHLDCPFCHDVGGHLGFAEGSPVGHCFKCGKHALNRTLVQLLSCSWGEAVGLVDKVCTAVPVQTEELKPNRQLPQIKIGTGGTTIPHSRHVCYLMDRDWDTEELIDWGVCYTHHIEIELPPWSIVIPIHDENGRLVSWQARDITETVRSKYLTAPGTDVKQILYGLHHVPPSRRSIIVVEGVTDAWRLGRGNAVATFGQDYSREQVKKLRKCFDTVWIMYDAENPAQAKANQLADELRALGTFAYCFNCGVLNRADPGEMLKEEAEAVVGAMLEEVIA